MYQYRDGRGGGTLIIKNLVNGYREFNENAQSISGRFAACSKDSDGFVALEATMKCRDYFSDYLVATYAGTDYTKPIYGFTAQGKSNPMPLDALHLYFDGDFERVDNNLHIIHEIEEGLDVKTEVNYVSTEEGKDPRGAVYTASSFWLKDTFHLHFYTLLIRTLSALDTLDSLEELLYMEAPEYFALGDWRNFEKGIKSLYNLGFIEKTISGPSFLQEKFISEVDFTTLKIYHNVGGAINLASALLNKDGGDALYKGAGDVEAQYRLYKQLLVENYEKEQAAA